MVKKAHFVLLFFLIFLGGVVIFGKDVLALNIQNYSDTLSDSGPDEQSNHTFEFTLSTALSPSSYIEVTPPSGFVVSGTSSFHARNVELYVNNVPRTAAAAAAPGIDQVDITPGSPGSIRYTLAPNIGIPSGADIELRIGNHTSNAVKPSTSFSTTTGTTTNPGDIEPIKNSPTTGTKRIQMEIYDGGLVAEEEFIVAIVRKVLMPNVDTTETIPPFRFNPAPTSTVGGTTLSVEISLETDEFAICRFSTVAGVAFSAMPNTFSNTGLIYHSTVVGVTPNSLQQFFVRCIDDEGNFNTDDFLIAFSVNDQPTGQSNTDGDVEGSGTGSGNDGTGDGSGSGGQTGDSSGEQPEQGQSSGTGGGGGGGGGGSGGRTGNTAGGGFESEDAAFPSGDGRVIINGFAYPGSRVNILVDGNFADSTTANSSGQYSITIDQIARGVYTFGVYAEDSNDVRSSTFSTSFTVTGSRTSSLSNINVAPSIEVSPDPVDPGQTLTVSGYALPNAVVSIQNGKLNSSNLRDFNAQSDSSGRWSTTIPTSGFTVGTYQIRAKSEQESGAETNYSEFTFYGVGQAADVPLNADLNRDGKVNLIDFSILLFWWNSNGGDSDPPADINRDGRVNLTDFSILLFNWTG